MPAGSSTISTASPETADAVPRFSAKAQLYACYRWSYVPAAVEALVAISGTQPGDAVADIASGTGALSELLLSSGLRVLAIEPNAEMRAIAERSLAGNPRFVSIAARSEATTLPDGCIRLAAVGRALHWLPAKATRREFLRILSVDGWLAVIGTPCRDTDLIAAMDSLQTSANGWDVRHRKRNLLPSRLAFFFGGDHYQVLQFPQTVVETWEEFFGRLLSLSSAPDPGSAACQRFEGAARRLFDQLAPTGQLSIPVTTELCVGRMLL